METWFVTGQYVEKLFESNNGEADTRIVLHALCNNTNAVIVSKDTDVLILLVYMQALKKHDFQVVHKIRQWTIHWRKKNNWIGKYVILKLPHIHAVTGCDTTSYLHGKGKIKVFENCVNSKEKMNLLQDIGVPSTINEKLLIKFQNLIKKCANPEWQMNQSQRQE